MIDNKTTRLQLPLPDVDNYLEDDVARLQEALHILDNAATVDESGKIPVAQLPAVAITDTFPVDSEAAMLALAAQPGDVAIRSDVSQTFILMEEPASELGNWKVMLNDALTQLNTTAGASKVKAASGQTVQQELDNSAAKDKLLMRLHFGKVAQDMGCTLSTGTFEDGATITSATQLLLDESTQRVYAFSGTIQGGGLVVAPGTDPTSDPQWVDMTAEPFRYKQPFSGSTSERQIDRNSEYVRPEEFGAKHTAGNDDTPAFHLALATGKRLKLGAHTYRVNLVLTQHFDIEGQGMDRTKLIAFDKTKPVVKNMFQEPKWNYPSISKMSITGAGTNEGVGFSFGDFSTYNTGDELIGRVRMTDVYFSNLDKCILKCYGNIGNVFANVSAYGGNYFYYARGAQFGNASSGVMHAGADLFVGGQVTGMQKMVCLVLDTTVGIGQWTFVGTVFQFNQGGLFYWDVSGNSFTAWQAVSFNNVWIEGNATLPSVVIDGLSGPHAIAPSEKFQQTSYGPDYCSWGKTVQHGTTSVLGRVNVWGNERIALNLEAGGFGSGDYVDLAFSNKTVPTLPGAYIRSQITTGENYVRDIKFYPGNSKTLELRSDKSVIIGEGPTYGFEPGAGVHGIYGVAAIAPGSTFVEFAGPQGNSTARIKFKVVTGSDGANGAACAATFPTSISTGRSINAGGTINASGADYAEYMVKDEQCGDIAKGAICGVTADGLLTDQFDRAVSFVVKSTDPAYVGGDTWGSLPEPERHSPEYAAWLADCARIKAAEPVRMEDETDEQLEQRINEWAASVEQVIASEPIKRDSDEWLAWEAELEAMRQLVDRVAFSGQVPCNVHGAQPGDYIVPVRNDDGSISGQAVKDPSFDQYRRSVGQVWKVLEDGRAWIAVKIA